MEALPIDWGHKFDVCMQRCCSLYVMINCGRCNDNDDDEGEEEEEEHIEAHELLVMI